MPYANYVIEWVTCPPRYHLPICNSLDAAILMLPYQDPRCLFRHVTSADAANMTITITIKGSLPFNADGHPSEGL